MERDTLKQELLLANAQTARTLAQKEMKKLETQNNMHAHQAFLKLEQHVTRLNEMVDKLIAAQEMKTIERMEVELRSIENKIFGELKRLNFSSDTNSSDQGK